MTRNKRMAMRILEMMDDNTDVSLEYNSGLDRIWFMKFDDDREKYESVRIHDSHTYDEAVKNFIRIKNIIKELKNAK